MSGPYVIKEVGKKRINSFNTALFTSKLREYALKCNQSLRRTLLIHFACVHDDFTILRFTVKEEKIALE